MFISALNRFLSKHGKIAIWGIGFVMIVPFVFFFTPSGCGNGPGVSRGNVVMKIQGEAVHRSDFEIQRDRFAMQSLTGAGIPAEDASEGALRRLQVQALLEKEKLDYVPAEQAQDVVRKLQFFQGKAGGFDANTFNQVMENFAKQGISRGAFQELVEENVALSRIEGRATTAASPSEAEAKFRFLSYFTESHVSTKTLFSSDFSKDLEISDEQAEQYFNDNQDSYKVPPQRRLKAARFPNQLVVISDEQIETYFAEHEADKEEIELRNLARKRVPILPAPQGEQSEEARKLRLKQNSQRQTQNDLARTSLKLALAQLESGDKTFDELSEDNTDYGSGTGWFDLGGDRLDNFGEGAKAAILALAETGQRSAVIEGDNHFYVFELVTPKRKKELNDEARASIRGKLKSEAETAIAKEHYGDGSGYPQAQLSMIQVDFPPNAPPADRQNLVNRLMTIRGQIQAYDKAAMEKRSLPALADDASDEQKAAHEAGIKKLDEAMQANKSFEFHAQSISSDEEMKQRGGQMLGWKSRFDPLPQVVSQTAFSLQPGELSDVLQDQSSCYLIRCQRLRDTADPGKFSDLKQRVFYERQREHAAAVEAKAKAFAEYVLEGFYSGQAAKRDHELFSRLAAEYSGESPLVLETGYFGEGDSEVEGLPGSNHWGFVRGALELDAGRPLSQIMRTADAVYVGCFVNEKPESPASFWETDDEGEKQRSRFGRAAFNDLQQELAMAKAKEKAAEIAAQVEEALGTGASFKQASAAHGFLDRGSFLLSEGPLQEFQGREMPARDARVVSEVARRTPEGKMAAPEETGAGLILLYVHSHTLPNPFEPQSVPAGPGGEEREFTFEDFFSNVQRVESFRARMIFYDMLDQAVPVDISDDWISVVDPDAAPEESTSNE